MKSNVAGWIKSMVSIRSQKMLLLSSALVVMLSFASYRYNEALQFCCCSTEIKIRTSLSLGHSVSRCTTQQAIGVSWVSWFTGSSATKQFHYLDLLELLSRVMTSNAEKTSNN